jgi:hypothetical protein
VAPLRHRGDRDRSSSHPNKEVAWLSFYPSRDLDDRVQLRNPKTTLKQTDLRAVQARPFGDRARRLRSITFVPPHLTEDEFVQLARSETTVFRSWRGSFFWFATSSLID